jgi:hypothetical protein
MISSRKSRPIIGRQTLTITASTRVCSKPILPTLDSTPTPLPSSRTASPVPDSIMCHNPHRLYHGHHAHLPRQCIFFDWNDRSSVPDAAQREGSEDASGPTAELGCRVERERGKREEYNGVPVSTPEVTEGK